MTRQNLLWLTNTVLAKPMMQLLRPTNQLSWSVRTFTWTRSMRSTAHSSEVFRIVEERAMSRPGEKLETILTDYTLGKSYSLASWMFGLWTGVFFTRASRFFLSLSRICQDPVYRRTACPFVVYLSVLVSSLYCDCPSFSAPTVCLFSIARVSFIYWDTHHRSFWNWICE